MTTYPGQEPATPGEEIVDSWNRRVSVGSPVRYWPMTRQFESRVGRTRTPAQLLGGATPCVWIEGARGCIALSHVDPIPEDEYAEAQNTGQDVSTSTETPSQPITGSGDERTSETALEALTDGETLRLFVHEYGDWFATRAHARKVRTAALELLAQHEDADTLILDFGGVQAMTNSSADDLVGELVASQAGKRSIVVDNAGEGVREAVALTLTRRGLAHLRWLDNREEATHDR